MLLLIAAIKEILIWATIIVWLIIGIRKLKQMKNKE